MTLCFADVGLCDVYFRCWFVCVGFCRFFPRWFYHNFRWTKLSRNGRVELFSSSLVNCVWGCKLLMWSSSSCRQALHTIKKTSLTWHSQTLGGWSAVVMAVVSDDCI